jgi:signal transduction protein with GAF and PtsI domain
VDACSLRIYDAGRQTITLLSSFGLGEDWRGKKVIAYKDSVVKRAFEKGSPQKIIDLASDVTYHSKNLARKSNFTSMLSIPLIFRGKLVGGLSLYVGPDKKVEILENDFIEKYAELVSVVLWSFRQGRS